MMGKRHGPVSRLQDLSVVVCRVDRSLDQLSGLEQPLLGLLVNERARAGVRARHTRWLDR